MQRGPGGALIGTGVDLIIDDDKHRLRGASCYRHIVHIWIRDGAIDGCPSVPAVSTVPGAIDFDPEKQQLLNPSKEAQALWTKEYRKGWEPKA